MRFWKTIIALRLFSAYTKTYISLESLYITGYKNEVKHFGLYERKQKIALLFIKLYISFQKRLKANNYLQ